MRKWRVIIIGLSFLTMAAWAGAQTMERIILPAPELESGKNLMQVLQKRRSQRAFSPQDLPETILGNLLWAAQGVNRPESGKRTAPSARDMREIDVYVAMAQGLYVYDPENHVLEPVLSEDIRGAVGIQEFTQVAPANLIYVADHARMGKDSEQNQFYAATDTGFISQNVYLYCASEGLATVVIGWIDKPALAEKMRLNNSQHIILAQPVGFPAQQ